MIKKMQKCVFKILETIMHSDWNFQQQLANSRQQQYTNATILLLLNNFILHLRFEIILNGSNI